jgi:hypothetical protein
LAQLRCLGQNSQSKIDQDYPQNYEILMVKMVDSNSIMTISTIPDYFVVEIVEISVDFDHLTMIIR